MKGRKDAATQIYPRIFLGPCSSASNASFLTTNSVTHILSIGSTPNTHLPNLEYQRLPLTDSPSSSITQVVEAATAFIDTALASRNDTGVILLHCSAAVSRSPTVLVAYLMKRHGLSLKAALGRVVLARSSVSPNAGFLAQLKDMELVLLGSSSLSVDTLPRKKGEREKLFLETGP